MFSCPICNSLRPDTPSQDLFTDHDNNIADSTSTTNDMAEIEKKEKVNEVHDLVKRKAKDDNKLSDIKSPQQQNQQNPQNQDEVNVGPVKEKIKNIDDFYLRICKLEQTFMDSFWKAFECLEQEEVPEEIPEEIPEDNENYDNLFGDRMFD